MKTFIASLLFCFASSYAFAAVSYKADIDIKPGSKNVSGKVTMKGETDTALYIAGFYDLVLDGKPVFTRAYIVNMPLDDGLEHILEFKKNVDNEDIIEEDFISVSKAAPLPFDNNGIKKTFNVSLPSGFTAIGEAEEAEVKNNIHTFLIDKPLESFNIIASKKYSVKKNQIPGVDIYTYFFKENAGLAEGYLKAAAGYIKMYEELFRIPFPYSRFSIVEHISPYGYATPTYTVLGSSVLRLPFIKNTSLGHEVLHQWFGGAINGKGNANWLEAITAYFADMFYLKPEERAAYRKNIMADYDIYEADNKTYPLEKFRFNDSRLSQTIGYGKGAMVFSMLEFHLGKEKFYEGIRNFINTYRFKNASWNDIFASFKNADLKDFKTFWLKENTVPILTVTGAEYTIEKGIPYISFDLKRENGETKMDIPYTLVYSSGETEGKLESLKASQHFKVPVKSGYVKLIIDRNYEIMRKLTKDESPVSIGHILEAEKLLGIKGKDDSCSFVFSSMRNISKVKNASEVTFKEAAENNIIICGYDNEAAKNLIGSHKPAQDQSEYYAFKNYRSPDKNVLVMHNPKPENFRLLKHYGKYSELVFRSQKNISKKMEKTENGITVLERQEDKGVDTSAVQTLGDIVASAKKYSAIFIGEQHTNYAHHINQLEIIKKLHESGRRIAVGFEMVQKQYQPVLNDFIQEKINEKEFLKKSGYFDRWQYDYNLYAPIFRYLRDNKINAVALNIDGDINRKISSGVADSLTEKEKEQLPEEMNLINREYEKEIRGIFGMHGMGKDFNKKFPDFFTAQNVWDETMAESAVKYQKSDPGIIMVVIAGSGHLRKDSGIPLRYKRLTGKEGYVILQDEEVGKDKADAVLFTSEVYGEGSPKLGVSVSQTSEGLKAEKIEKDSPAFKSGLVVKDVLKQCGDTEMESIGDLKYELFNAGYGNVLKCQVQRNGKTFALNIKLEKQAAHPSMEYMMKMMGN